MKVKDYLTSILLAASVSACSSTSNDTTALLIDTAQSCSTICSNNPEIESISYQVGGGSPLIFKGEVAASCGCSAAGR